MVLFAPLLLTVASQATPPNATDLQVVALRPYQIAGLNDKDSADIAGDIFFWIKDRVLFPMHCRRDPDWSLCNSTGILTHDSVYQQTLLSINPEYGNYASCNPNTTDPSGKTWHCRCHGSTPCAAVGRLDINASFGKNVSKGQFPGDIYSGHAAHILGGLWFSTTSQGNCSVSSESCNWIVKKVQKIKNATCVNGNIKSNLVKEGKTCFSGCADPEDETTDCWINCFFEAVKSSCNS
jgi:hypothetical protein